MSKQMDSINKDTEIAERVVEIMIIQSVQQGFAVKKKEGKTQSIQ